MVGSKLFHSKHQKLILQCYPPGKGVEKKPNSSELSYLLYYASTRRVKLEKVSTFLVKKSISDANKSKTNNLQVTLIIVASLIEKCKENLNVFALEVCTILQLGLKFNDISLAKCVLDTYATLCKHLDGELFVGDKRFVDTFTNVSEGIIKGGILNSKNNPNANEWKLISLLACQKISSCLGYSNDYCRRFLNLCIPILIECLQDFDGDNALFSVTSFNDDNHKLSKVVLARTIQKQKVIDEDLANDVVSSEDLKQSSLSGLQSYFDTTLTNQITDSAQIVIKHTFNSKASDDWCGKFLQLCTSWIPVQLRFIALRTLVSDLSKLSKSEKVKVPLQKHYSRSILCLLSSNVNMIGLSVSDLIQSILQLKQTLYIHQCSTLSNDDLSELSEIYSQCIVNLSTHIYYSDQVADSVHEIFIHIDSTLEFFGNDYDSSLNDNAFGFIKSLLFDVFNILTQLQDKTSTISRTHVGLDQWEISLALLAPKGSIKLYSESTAENVKDFQLTYLRLFKNFLENELVESSMDKSTSSGDKFLNPDFNQLISESTNFLSNYLIYVDQHISDESNLDFDVVNEILNVSYIMISKLGINFLNNFIPFFFHWQICNDNTDREFSISEKVKSTFGYSVLKNSLESIDDKYSEKLHGYSSKSSLHSNTLDDIGFKISKDIWIKLLNNINIENEKNISVTKDDFQSYISGNEFLSFWLNVQKPLVLNVLKDDLLNIDGIRESNDHYNGGGVVNENGTHLTNGNITIDSYDSINGTHDTKQTLGLGTVGDIASIHSGLMKHGASNGNGILNNGSMNGTLSYNVTITTNDHSNVSITSNNKHQPPKVSDLKEMLSDHSLTKPKNLEENITTPGSVLSKQMMTHDVGSILDDIGTDDESFVV